MRGAGALVRWLLSAGLMGLLLAFGALAHASIFVSSEKTGEVLRYHEDTGEFLGVFAAGSGLSFPEGLAFGPDGHLYVSSYMTNQILRFDGRTGDFIDVFVDAGNGGLECPVGLGFRGDFLYVSNRCTEAVLRFSAKTGAFEDVFAIGGLQLADWFVWGPDGDFFISSRANDWIKRFDGTTGADKGNFIEGSPLDFPEGLAFGPDGLLYVMSAESKQILRYEADSGAFSDVFAEVELGFGVLMHSSGDVLVSNLLTSSIDRFDGRTGQPLEPFVPPGAGGLQTPTFFLSHIVCGDGVVEAEEDCDDGGLVDGDGCSSRCEEEERSSGPGGGESGVGGSGPGPSGAGAANTALDPNPEELYGRGCQCGWAVGDRSMQTGAALLGLLALLTRRRKRLSAD